MAQAKVRLPLDLPVEKAQAIENAAKAWNKTKIGLVLEALEHYGVNFDQPNKQPKTPRAAK
jgi:hypothetical protein